MILVLPILILRYKRRGKHLKRNDRFPLFHDGMSIMPSRDMVNTQMDKPNRATFLAMKWIHMQILAVPDQIGVFLEYTGELCEVTPFLSTYEPVSEIPIARCCTVWTDQSRQLRIFIGGRPNVMVWNITSKFPH